MILSEWTAIREYIAAEVRLGIARHIRNMHDFRDHANTPPTGIDEKITALEEQSTRMETAVRAALSGGASNG